MGKTAISWANLGLQSGESINPIRARNKETGQVGHFCVKYGAGCVNCYAAAFQQNPRNQSFGIGIGLDYVTSNRAAVEIFWDNKHATRPFRTSRPVGFFPCDMTDWLGWDWGLPTAMSYRVLAACAIAPWNRYFLLTKRYKNLLDLIQSDYNTLTADEIGNLGLTEKQMANRKTVDGVTYSAPSFLQSILSGNSPARYQRDLFTARNIWLGLSICTQADADRALPVIVDMLDIFHEQDVYPIIGISYEPCLEWIDWKEIMPLVDWLIVGGESNQGGAKGRQAELAILESAIEMASHFGVKAYVKQLGNHLAQEMGIRGKGAHPEEWPDSLRVQEFPEI